MCIRDRVHHAHRVHIECATLQCILGAAITHIDVLSLDIEGYELSALQSFNFSAVTIDVILAENIAVAPLLRRQHGYRVVNMFTPRTGEYAYIRHGFQLGIERANGSKGLLRVSQRKRLNSTADR